MNKTVDEQTIVRYLLGELSEKEQNQIEQKYFVDDDYNEHLLDVEDELNHRYVQNELSKKDRESFEKYFLSDPKRLQKVKLAKALIIYLNEEKQTQEDRKGKLAHGRFNSWGAFLNSLKPRKLSLQVSFAVVALLIIIGGLWTFQEFKGLRTQLTELEGERLRQSQREQALQRQVDRHRELNEKMAEQLEGESKQRAVLEEQLNESRTPQRELFAIALEPYATRSPGKINRLNLPKEEGLQLAALTLYLENKQAYESYFVILETIGGDTILSQYQLETQQTPEGKVITLTLPTNILSYDDYLLTVKGVLSRGKTEKVNDYFLRVVRK